MGLDIFLPFGLANLAIRLYIVLQIIFAKCQAAGRGSFGSKKMESLRNLTVLIVVITIVSIRCLFAQDPGVADTLSIGSDSCACANFGVPSQSIPIPVFLANDEELTSIEIPLLIDCSSGWATFDSVSFTGGRLDDPAILDFRQAVIVETDSFVTEKVSIQFGVSSGLNLAVGSGQICKLWFRVRFGGTVVLDTSGASGLILTDVSATSFVPQFQSGEIQIACDYVVGDADGSGHANSNDWLRIHKCLVGHFWVSAGYYQSFDINCDRHLDLRDINYLISYSVYDGHPPCSCGTYNPAYYFDPGVRDTVSFASDTMYVGIPEFIEFNLFNDEAIRSFSFNWNVENTTILRTPWRFADDMAGPRINPLYVTELNDYEGYGSYPNQFGLSSWRWEIDTLISPGSGHVFSIRFEPLAPGTTKFRMVNYEPPGNAESMLTGLDNNAILPVFVSGTITVLPFLCGDADKNAQVNISDVVFLINYIFSGGTAPNPLESADADCSGSVTISDVVYLINYIFFGGPDPCAMCL